MSKVKDIPEDYWGVMGVPITFMDKYNPDQFDIVAFRKGDDGRDLVFTREREREYNRTFAYSSGDGDSRAHQECGGAHRRADNLRPHHHTPQIEPIDRDHPIATNLANGLVNDCTINGRKTYVRILIRRKEQSR